jgi:hypothetical protein
MKAQTKALTLQERPGSKQYGDENFHPFKKGLKWSALKKEKNVGRTMNSTTITVSLAYRVLQSCMEGPDSQRSHHHDAESL